jgi:hypothetical protein
MMIQWNTPDNKPPNWLKAEKDASGDYQTARGKELHAVMRHIEKENGQLDLFENAGDPA